MPAAMAARGARRGSLSSRTIRYAFIASRKTHHSSLRLPWLTTSFRIVAIWSCFGITRIGKPYALAITMQRPLPKMAALET